MKCYGYEPKRTEQPFSTRQAYIILAHEYVHEYVFRFGFRDTMPLVGDNRVESGGESEVQRCQRAHAD